MEKKKYVPGQAVLDAQAALEAHRGKHPGSYVSPWQGAADALLQQLQNRGPFHYDPQKDLFYRQAVDRYVQLGRQAMMDTMGRAAALTGGYGNSYAETAAQQAYDGYLQALAAKLPQFQEMALQRHQAEGKDLLDRYQVLFGREQAARGQYEKAVDRYFSELDRLQGAYDRQQDRDYGAFTDQRNFDYAADRDAKEAARLQEEALREQARFDAQKAYQAQRDQILDDRWAKEFEEKRRQHDEEMALRREVAARSRRGGGGGSRRGKESYLPKEVVAFKKAHQFQREDPYRMPNYRRKEPGAFDRYDYAY